MKLSRTDVLPICAIACGGIVGSAFTTALLHEALDDGPHVVRHEVVHVRTSGDVTWEPYTEESTDETVEPATMEGSASWSSDGRLLRFTDGDGSQWVLVRDMDDNGEVATLRGGGSDQVWIQSAIQPKPIIYLDGVRLHRDASVEEIEPTSIDRIEIVKGEAAIDLFGEEATGGVIQIYLKENPQVSTIRLRGQESISQDAEPLIYVDGVRLEGDQSIDDYDPEQIDRIEVIKNAAALELYGDEAAGGVIQIFLKKKSESGGR